MNARPAGFLRFATLFAALALLSCGKEEPPLDESLPIGEFDELWPGKVLGCGVPLNRETDKPLASFEELKNADCDTLIFSRARHRDKWDELARLGDCSDGGGAEMDYRAIFRESATGKIVLGIGREGRTLQLEDGRKCAVAEENVLDVCRIYNELFGTPESQIFCPRPFWIAGKAAADSGASRLKWRESDWARLKRERAELGDSAVAVYGIDLATKFRSRVDPAWLVGPDAGSDVRRTVLTSEQARRFVRLFREAGKCSSQEVPIAYRAFGIDMRGRFVFGIGESAFELAVHVGKDEYCLVPFGKRTPVRLLYEEIFPSNAPRTAEECEVVAKAVVDSILRGDMKYPSHFKNGFEAGCPFDLFRKDLRKGPAKCRAHRLAQTFRFLDGEYPELILPAFTESFLLAARGREKIAWDEDLCLALRHIYWLNTDELIQPLVKAGFTYEALDKRCHFGEPKPTLPPPIEVKPSKCLLSWPLRQRLSFPRAGFHKRPAWHEVSEYNDCIADTAKCRTIEIDEEICRFYADRSSGKKFQGEDDYQEKRWIIAYIHSNSVSVGLTYRMNAVDVANQKFTMPHPPEMNCSIYRKLMAAEHGGERGADSLTMWPPFQYWPPAFQFHDNCLRASAQ